VVTLALAMVAVAVIGGANSAVATHNGMIGRRLGPWRATFVFMSVGAVCALGFVLVWERAALDLALLRGLPPYALLPGLLNTAMVATVIRVVSQIGTMQATASIFSGSVLVGLLVDHVGAFGLSTIPGSGTRVVGALLLVTAVVLMTMAHRQREARAAPVVVPAVAAAIAVGAYGSDRVPLSPPRLVAAVFLVLGVGVSLV
jgi:bacterial/archaeal transporter family-2 protein